MCKKVETTAKALAHQKEKRDFQKKSLGLQNSIEEKQHKEKLLLTEREKLVKKINEFGGLRELNDIPTKLKKFQIEKDKK